MSTLCTQHSCICQELLRVPNNVHQRAAPGLSRRAAVTVAHKAASASAGPCFFCAWHATAAVGAEKGLKGALAAVVLAVLQVLLVASMVKWRKTGSR
jgi:hypothetical protein